MTPPRAGSMWTFCDGAVQVAGRAIPALPFPLIVVHPDARGRRRGGTRCRRRPSPARSSRRPGCRRCCRSASRDRCRRSTTICSGARRSTSRPKNGTPVRPICSRGSGTLSTRARHHHEHPAGDRTVVGLRDERHVEPQLRRWGRLARLRMKAPGRRQRDGRQGGADRAGYHRSDMLTPMPGAHRDGTTFGNDSSPPGSRCFSALT